jgi:rare lipoprotein A
MSREESTVRLNVAILSALLLAGLAPTATAEAAHPWKNAAIAPWYGPGYYGNRTACGQVLTRELRGVAHRTLPCGTKIRLRWQGRSVTVKVVDRGPYPARHLYGKMPLDLTAATSCRDLGGGRSPCGTKYNVKWKVVH